MVSLYVGVSRADQSAFPGGRGPSEAAWQRQRPYPENRGNCLFFSHPQSTFRPTEPSYFHWESTSTGKIKHKAVC